MRFTTKIASMAVATGLGVAALLAPQSAQAGITITATANGNPVTGLNGFSLLSGTDPVTQPNYEIVATPSPSSFAVGNGANLTFTGFVLTQSYNPSTGPVGGIVQALGDSTTVQIRNTGTAAATLVMTITYNAFNYPIGNPLTWVSNIASTRLDGGATYGASETIRDSSGIVGSVVHTTLTGANVANNTASQNIASLVSPGRPFSIEQVLTVFLPAGAIANIQKSDTLSVPEPATLALLGAGLLGLAATRRRKAA